MSDVGTQTRFLIPKESVYDLILKYLKEEEIIKVEGIDHEGLNINVFDSDTKTIHPLCFMRWNSAKNYVFNGTWRDFVDRRDLKEGNEIGLFWNPHASRLHFCVLA
ncbi:B3 domain-containing protein [Cardamine amara subsp. amara]|uniref:B3 domain-containing protein n=1 Tax=Cardamine amara subsp. amara TaxID=228776 RepID=A0ABD1B4S1_CARAN